MFNLLRRMIKRLVSRKQSSEQVLLNNEQTQVAAPQNLDSADLIVAQPVEEILLPVARSIVYNSELQIEGEDTDDSSDEESVASIEPTRCENIIKWFTSFYREKSVQELQVESRRAWKQRMTEINGAPISYKRMKQIPALLKSEKESGDYEKMGIYFDENRDGAFFVFRHRTVGPGHEKKLRTAVPNIVF